MSDIHSEHVPLRLRLAARGIDGVTLLVLPLVVALILLFVYPFLYGLWLSFRPKDGSLLGNYMKFFSDPFLYETVGKTLWLAIPVTVINLVVAIPVALRVRLMRRQRVLTTILVLPITLGTVLVAEGMLNYFGPQGWFNRVLLTALGPQSWFNGTLMDVFGPHGWLDQTLTIGPLMTAPLISGPLKLVHNYTGVLLSLVITGFPFTFLLVLSYLTGIDPALEKAAATLGAGPGSRFRHILMPLLLPGLAVTFCLGFVQAYSVFPSAVLLGAPSGPTRVISIAAYEAAFEQYDYSLASAIAMIMGATLLLVVLAVLGARTLVYRGPAGGGKG